MQLYERIKHLRKDILKKTQDEFSQIINISRSNLGNIETNKVNITDRVIADICKAYNVSEEWIRFERGDVFVTSKSTLVEQLTSEYNLGYYGTKLIECYIELPIEQKGIIDDFLKRFVESCGGNPAADDSGEDTETQEGISIYRAANSENNTEHEVLNERPDRITDFKKAPKVLTSDDL